MLLKTRDGGTTWVLQSTAKVKNLFSVYFPAVNIGYAVGSGGTILKTADTGNTWTVQPSGISSNLFCVRFTDVNAGYATGGYGVILKTINGGLSWVAQASGTTRDIYSIHFPTVDTAYAVGFGTGSGSGGILKSPPLPALVKQSATKHPFITLEMGRNGVVWFDLLKRSPVKLSVLDLRGRLAANVLEETWDSGLHFVDLSNMNLLRGSYLLDFRMDDYHRAIRFRR